MINKEAITLLTALIFTAPAIAEPEYVADEAPFSAGFTGLDFVPKKGDGCELHQGLMLITGSQYSQSGKVVELLKFQRLDREEFMIPTNFGKLNNADMSESSRMFQKGDIVFIRFSICGNGGFTSLIDILKPFQKIEN